LEDVAGQEQAVVRFEVRTERLNVDVGVIYSWAAQDE
jgi:hypothetical protein